MIDDYEVEWRAARKRFKQNRIVATQQETVKAIRIEPNSMQKVFIKNVTELYLSGQTKALLISATGTGKTYAAALAVRHLMNLRTKKEDESSKVLKAPKKFYSLFTESRLQFKQRKALSG